MRRHRSLRPRRSRGTVRWLPLAPFAAAGGGVRGPAPARRGGAERRWILPLVAVLLLVVAPALARAQEAADSVVVRWSAPGDDGVLGTATQYDLRVSESPITAENFDAATAVPGLPAPGPSGSRERVAVRGLTRGTVYYFALRTVDDAGNWSGISNLARWDWTLDTAPPSAPLPPRAERNGESIRLTWEPSAESDLAGYHVYRRTNHSAAPERLTADLLDTEEFVDAAVPRGASEVWYEVSAVDLSGNESAHSASSKISFVTTTAWALEPAYPNPSRVGDPVRFPVFVPANVSGDAALEILDAAGRRVRRIVLASPQPGTQEVVWDGFNDSGRACAPGVYRGWLVAGDTRTGVRVLRVP